MASQQTLLRSVLPQAGGGALGAHSSAQFVLTHTCLKHLGDSRGLSPDDALLGDDGPNVLIGFSVAYDSLSDDRLVGRGGDDVLDALDRQVGSDETDSVDGGEGNDSCRVDPDDELISCKL